MEWLTSIIQSFSKPLKWWIVVSTWEQGLRVRLGRNPKLLEPGIHFRMPFLDRVYVKSVRMQCVSVNGYTLTSVDDKPFTVAIAINYSIADIKKLYESVATPESVMLSKALAGISESIACRPASEISLRSVTEAAQGRVDELDFGLGDVEVIILSFATVRTYRMMTGDCWLPTGINIDESHGSSER